MSQNYPVAENGKFNNTKAKPFLKNKKRNHAQANNLFHGKNNTEHAQKLNDNNELVNSGLENAHITNSNCGAEKPLTPAVSNNISSTPVVNHGFVRNSLEPAAAKVDFFKYVEPKSAPSKTPDEPLKELSPMQKELETFLPEGANFAVLPAKLSEKFSLTKCELCNVNMLSLVQSKMHYNGKPHTKKVRAFLINECGKTDEPPIKVAKIDLGQDLKGDESKECRICNVVFNSSIHASQHYVGKKHKKAVVTHARKTGSAGDDSDGRFGIGTAFASSESAPKVERYSISKQFYCELCDVQGSSSEQYNMHLAGARHAKNLKKINGNDPNFSKFYCNHCDYNANTQKQFSIHVKTDAHGEKFKRTQKEQCISSFDLSDDEIVSKYEDY